MSNSTVGYEIREAETTDGGVALDLIVEGGRVARAAASASALEDMERILGIPRETALANLRRALLAVLTTPGQFVQLADPVEDPTKKLRFSSHFVYRFRDEVSTGIVWYDVTESTTGPESLPPVVRNKMRHEVHRKLTEPGSTARALVDLHE